jgi:putative restriction endonuclease
VCSSDLAWDYFGNANGVASLEEMVKRCAHYRKESTTPLTDIGCVILSNPTFLEEEDWIQAPSDWPKNTVKGKYYETSEGPGANLWEVVWAKLKSRDLSSLTPDTPQLGPPRVIIPRLGQGGFRAAVTDAYERRCAITGERTVPALEAAHIKPFSIVKLHEVRNGLLLRSDIHRLFDQGYVTVDSDCRFIVSRRIKEEWQNGRDYYALHGREIWVPSGAGLAPDPDALQWHAGNIYRD